MGKASGGAGIAGSEEGWRDFGREVHKSINIYFDGVKLWKKLNLRHGEHVRAK